MLLSKILMSSKKTPFTKHPVAAKDADFKIPSSITSSSDGVRLSILAKPGAKQNKITDISDSNIGIQINAPPREGQANEELVDYLAQVLGLKKRQLALISGAKDRNKTVLVTESNVQEVFDKLSKASTDI